MQIEEALSRPRWITASDVCLILNIVQKPNSITNLQVHNNLTFLQTYFKTVACFLARLQDIKRYFLAHSFLTFLVACFQFTHAQTARLPRRYLETYPAVVSGRLWLVMKNYNHRIPIFRTTLVRIVGRFEKSGVKYCMQPSQGNQVWFESQQARNSEKRRFEKSRFYCIICSKYFSFSDQLKYHG